MEQGAIPTGDPASRTHDDVRGSIVQMLDAAGVRHGIDGRASDHFVTDVYGRPGMATSVEFRRAHQVNEFPFTAVTSGEIPCTATETMRTVVDMHVARLARVMLRQRHGLRTDQSLGDPMWSMSVHRLVAEIVIGQGIQLNGHHDCTCLRKAMATRFTILNMMVDAGRFHPLGMRLRRGGGEASCYLTATTTGHDVKTAITVPKGTLPQTVMLNAVGRRLGDIVDMPGRCGDAVISSIEHKSAFGLHIALEHDDVPLADAPAGRSRPWLMARPD